MDNFKYKIYLDDAFKAELKVLDNNNKVTVDLAQSIASYENLHSTNPKAHKTQFDVVGEKINIVETKNTELQKKLDSKPNFYDLPSKVSQLENDCICAPIIGQKMNISLDNITEEGVELIKSYIPTPESSSTCFSVNSGYVNAGRAEILYFDDLRHLKFRTPIIATKADGKSFTVNNLNSIDFFGQVDGTYNIALTETSAEVIGNIFMQNAAPYNAVGNVWLDTAVEPLKAFKYDGTDWLPYDGVPLGSVTIVGGSISAVKTFEYNQNGYDIKNNDKYKKMIANASMPDYLKGISKEWQQEYTAESSGFLFVYYHASADSTTLMINNAVFNIGWGAGMGNSFITPILEGDVYKVFGGTGTKILTFYPCKAL